MTTPEKLALCRAFIGVTSLLWLAVVLTYWLLNPAEMLTGGRPALVGVSLLIGLAGVGVWRFGPKASKR